MFSCGRAKTIRIRQRILRKYSEVRKNTHYCVGHGKALDFLSISLRDTVPIMHTHEERLFFFSSPYCFCEGKLFSEVNLWHLTALSSLWLLAHKAFKESSTFLGWLLWISLRPVIPILLSFFLSFFLFQPCAYSWSLVFLFFCFLLVPKSLLCCSRCFGPLLVYVRSCLICSFTLFHLFTRKAINLVNLV